MGRTATTSSHAIKTRSGNCRWIAGTPGSGADPTPPFLKEDIRFVECAPRGTLPDLSVPLAAIGGHGIRLP